MKLGSTLGLTGSSSSERALSEASASGSFWAHRLGSVFIIQIGGLPAYEEG